MLGKIDVLLTSKGSVSHCASEIVGNSTAVVSYNSIWTSIHLQQIEVRGCDATVEDLCHSVGATCCKDHAILNPRHCGGRRAR